MHFLYKIKCTLGQFCPFFILIPGQSQIHLSSFSITHHVLHFQWAEFEVMIWFFIAFRIEPSSCHLSHPSFATNIPLRSLSRNIWYFFPLAIFWKPLLLLCGHQERIFLEARLGNIHWYCLHKSLQLWKKIHSQYFPLSNLPLGMT